MLKGIVALVVVVVVLVVKAVAAIVTLFIINNIDGTLWIPHILIVDGILIHPPHHLCYPSVQNLHRSKYSESSTGSRSAVITGSQIAHYSLKMSDSNNVVANGDSNDHDHYTVISIEYRNDLIWIIPSSSSSSQSNSEYVVPLLSSTVQLLQQQLQATISVPFITSIDDTVTHPHQNSPSANDNDVNHLTNDMVVSLQVTETNGDDTNITPLSLTRVTGLADHVMNAINDFRTMRRANTTILGRLLEQEQKQSSPRRRRYGRGGQNNNNNNNNRNGALSKPEQGSNVKRSDVKESGVVPTDKNEIDDDEEEEEEEDIIVQDGVTGAVVSRETSAWYILIATFNSLRILTPILFHLLWHPQRNHKELLVLPPPQVTNGATTVNGPADDGNNNNNTSATTSVVHANLDDENDDDEDDDDYGNYDDGDNDPRRDEVMTAMTVTNKNPSRNSGRRNRDRNAKCWLIGTKVYDQCSVRQCKLIWKNLEHIYYLLGVVSAPTMTTITEQEQTLQSYMKIVTTNMEVLMAGYQSSIAPCIHDDGDHDIKNSLNETEKASHDQHIRAPSSVSWLNYHPFDDMDEYDQTKLYMSTKILDQRFELQVNNDSLNPKDKREKDTYLKAIYELHEQLKGMLSNRYPGSRISVYGSCLSDLSLGKNADVDFSLFIEELADTKNDYEMKKITEETYRSVTKKYVYTTCRLLERHRKQRFQNMNPVAHARVPVVKGTYVNCGNPHTPDGSLEFDICFINDIAVSNSELIRQYSLVSDTVKSLMILVKRWAKANHLSSTQDNAISSYAWMNLVIYYMQCIGIVPNLQCPNLMTLVNHTTNKEGAYWDNVNFLNTRFITWDQASTVWTVPEHRQRNMSITALLYGFFDFYAKTFPSTLYMVSIATGATVRARPKTLFNKASLFWCIEDPFELSDSYCPHDLGMHASEPGSALILECLRAAETYLRTQLLQVLDMDGDAMTAFLLDIHSLWPPVKLAISVKDESKPNNRGNAPRKNPIRTTGNVEDMNIEAKPDVWPTLAAPKKPAISHVKAGPAISSSKTRNSLAAKQNNGGTAAKPTQRRNNHNHNGNNVKTGPSTSAPPTTTTTNQKRQVSTTNNLSNRGKNNNSNNSGDHRNSTKQSDPRRPRRPPPPKTTTPVAPKPDAGK